MKTYIIMQPVRCDFCCPCKGCLTDSPLRKMSIYIHQPWVLTFSFSNMTCPKSHLQRAEFNGVKFILTEVPFFILYIFLQIK